MLYEAGDEITVEVTTFNNKMEFVKFYIGTSTDDMPYDGVEFREDWADEDDHVEAIYYTFTGLENYTQYKLKAQQWRDTKEGEEADNDQGEVKVGRAVTIDAFTTGQRPDDWEWDTFIEKDFPLNYYTDIEEDSNGNDVEVIRFAPLTADEWEGFVDRVVEFHKYMHAALPDTWISDETKKGWYAEQYTPMTADKVNEMYTLISALRDRSKVQKPLPARAKSGRPVTADFFLKLAECLNNLQPK